MQWVSNKLVTLMLYLFCHRQEQSLFRSPRIDWISVVAFLRRLIWCLGFHVLFGWMCCFHMSIYMSWFYILENLHRTSSRMISVLASSMNLVPRFLMLNESGKKRENGRGPTFYATSSDDRSWRRDRNGDLIDLINRRCLQFIASGIH